MDTKEITTRCKQGDNLAFDKLFNFLDSDIIRYAGDVTKDYTDIREDFAQEARIRIFKSIPNFKEDCNIKTWAYTIIKNLYLDYLRKQKTKKEDLIEFSIDSLIDNDYIPGSFVIEDTILENLCEIEIKQQLKEKLYEELGKLSDKDKRLLDLFYFQEKTSKEIAEILGIKYATVRTRVYRATQILIDRLRPKFEEIAGY